MPFFGSALEVWAYRPATQPVRSDIGWIQETSYKEINMTGRDITKMALDLKEPPRTPVTIFGGGSWMVHSEGETFASIKQNPDNIANIFIKTFQKFGQDLLFTGSNFPNYPIHFLGCPIEDNSSDSPSLPGTAIQSLDDIGLLKIKKVLENQTMQGIIQAHHIIADTVGKETFTMQMQWAPFSCAARIFGAEEMMLATMENPDNLKKLIEFSTELIWAVIEPILSHEDIQGALIADPVASGDLISPETFKNFAAPALKEIAGRIKDKDKYVMIHICGDTSRIFEDILNIGPHCFSVDQKVDLKEAKEIFGGKVCIAGNVAPSGAFLSGTPEEVTNEASSCIEAWGGGGGFILTLGCDFPKHVPIDNVKALMSLKEQGS
jgi:uroporphyrinogen decarboxylase